MNEIHPAISEDDEPKLFPDTEMRRIAERFAPRRPVAVEAIHAIEEALRAPAALSDTLALRKKSHGEFIDDARTSQSLKYVMHQGKNWDDLTQVQQEALDQIATKIGRILSGDPKHPDHWNDIQGYARLVEERL